MPLQSIFFDAFGGSGGHLEARLAGAVARGEGEQERHFGAVAGVEVLVLTYYAALDVQFPAYIFHCICIAAWEADSESRAIVQGDGKIAQGS